MRITQEVLTVLPEAEQREVTILMAGMKVTLSEAEASLLADGLRAALRQLEGSARSDNAAAEPSKAAGRRAEEAEDPTVSFMITQAQRAALRKKGYDTEAIRNMKPVEAHRILGLLEG